MTSTFFSHRRCNGASLAKSALAAAVAVGTLAAGHAQAYVVTVEGVQYDVTTFTGTYNANTSKFALPPGGVMPWWGSQALADSFATAVGANLGTPNTYDGNTSGPVFAYGTQPEVASVIIVGKNWCIANCNYNPDDYRANLFDSVVYAQATPLYTAPVPAPLPLFGAAAAFGFSRQLRKRIKRAPGALGSGLPRA